MSMAAKLFTSMHVTYNIDTLFRLKPVSFKNEYACLLET